MAIAGNITQEKATPVVLPRGKNAARRQNIKGALKLDILMFFFSEIIH